MIEMYLISIMDEICVLGWLCLFAGVVVTIIYFVCCTYLRSQGTIASEADIKSNSDKELYRQNMYGKNVCKRLMPILLGIGLTVVAFVPNQKELAAIFGVGNLIEFVRTNPTAKQLPDKTVKVIDKYLSKLSDGMDAPEEKPIESNDSIN